MSKCIYCDWSLKVVEFLELEDWTPEEKLKIQFLCWVGFVQISHLNTNIKPKNLKYLVQIWFNYI